MKRLHVLHKQFSNLQAAIAPSTHARNVWKRKSALQARKNINTRATTIVSGAKNIVNQPKKQLKSSKIGAEGAENFGISAPILGKSCSQSSEFPPPPVRAPSVTRGEF